MSAHTPGPWSDDRVTRPNPIIEGGPLRLVMSGGFVVAFVPMWLDDERVEAAANARLIAAAPQLLEALETLVKELSEGDDEGLIEHAEPMQRARAAIAKAEGKA